MFRLDRGRSCNVYLIVHYGNFRVAELCSVMSQQRLSETALKLLELAKPKYIKGRWRKPLISNRELAVSRKALVLQGEYWPPKPLVNRGADKPFKLHAWERGKTR